MNGGVSEREGEVFGTLLRQFRGARGMTQEELAARSGLSVDAISMLERGRRGIRRAPRTTTIEFLATALKLDAQQKKALLEAAGVLSATTPAQPVVEVLPADALPPRAPLPAGSRMPLASNPLFVGRGDELLQVATALEGGDTTVALGQVVASTGLGGLGKTQLAVEFVHRYGRFFPGGVYWLSFASADEIPLQVAACAGPGFESRSVEERIRLVKDAWQSAVPRLLVFDNCEEESLLEAWRPTSGGCRVLVTSRRSHWSPTLGITALPLDLLPRPDSIELLRRYRPDLAPDDPSLDAVARELGDLPLALHLAGSYLRAYRAEVRLDDYLAELRRSEVLRHASLLGAGLGDSPSPTHHVQSLAQTFALCVGRLDREREEDRVAIALLARMAWLAPGEAVPRELLGRTLEAMGARRRADGLRRLGAIGLVEEGEGWLRLHRLLVHFVRRECLDPDARPAVAQALIGCGEDASENTLTGPALAAVIPHLVDAAGAAVGDHDDERLVGDLCDAAGRSLQWAGDLSAARPWFERALAIREQVLGPGHPQTAESLNNLALLLWDQGELAVAKPLFERALAIRERVLGPNHPDTAQGLNNLALLLRAQGELAVARRLFERGLSIREQVLGPGHPLTANILNNLAHLLWAQGEVASARLLFERALAIWERLLGPDHPSTALCLNNLAGLLRDQGELASARALFERALAIRERVLGPEHPRTADSLNGLALLLWAQDEPAVASALFERALDIRKRVLGPDHPRTAESLNGLALLHCAQGELDVARALFERALDIRERVLGSDHPDTAISLNDLARLLQFAGELEAARPLFERALAIRERVLGPDHPDTVATRRALAELAGKANGQTEGGPAPLSWTGYFLTI
jgi:tetratricopeptide (TPR) repeat protein/transcriptional regulator with XRE-family HTH domain